jgi:hypothetical protein
MNIPEGKIRTRVIASALENCLATIGQKETPAVQIRFSIDKVIGPGNLPADITLEEGQTLTWSGWLTEACFDRTMGTLLQCFNWQGNDLELLNQDRGAFENMKAILVVDFEEYNGKISPKIAFVNPITSLRAMTPQKAQEVSAGFAERLAAFRKTQEANAVTPASLSAPAAGSPAPGQDELPF